MTKRTENLFRALRMLLTAACLMALFSFAAFGADQRVYDAAGLFSADKVSEIEAEIVSVREKTGLDIAVRDGEWFYKKALTSAQNGVKRCKQELQG